MRTKQTARKRTADEAGPSKSKKAKPSATSTATTSSSSSSSSSSSAAASLPHALPDPRSILDVDACGLNTSDRFAELIVQTLHKAIAHYASTHNLPYPEPADGYGCAKVMNDPPVEENQLSFFCTVPDTELVLLPESGVTETSRITAVPVPDDESAPVTLSSLAASRSIAYSRGMGYYQLTKPEKVSDSKQVVVRRDGEACMTGRAARFGPGIPPCGAKGGAVQVDPAELEAGWTVWVQSTSANRRLEPGTTALFDVDPSQKWPIG